MIRALLLLAVFLAGCWASGRPGVARPHHVIGGGPFTPEELNRERSIPNNRTRSTLTYFNPANKLRTIYGISSSATQCSGQTIAVIDAFGASSAATDLAYFSTENGLPAPNFQKYDQNGGTSYPADDPSPLSKGNWGLETALDLQSIHLFCPGAKIILIACNSASNSDLNKGVATAVNLGAKFISMSYGSLESSSESSDTTFTHSGVSFFASTGDSGAPAGVSYPASNPNVVAVGGTSVYTNSDGTVASEQGWTGSGGGCSSITAALSVQQSQTGYTCNGKKNLPDISMVADPNSGIVIYISQSNIVSSMSGYIVGGTSLASPLTAARAAIRASAVPSTVVTPSYIYTGLAATSIRDVTVGTNYGSASTNTPAYSCTVGLDKVTGRGTWIGAN